MRRILVVSGLLLCAPLFQMSQQLEGVSLLTEGSYGWHWILKAECEDKVSQIPKRWGNNMNRSKQH
ncbi:hypothetical protein LC065_12500 [Halobacillus litoralis]|uniref:hypothetical protein n=1 Tax=Halobacillus litoralis TaxID=45668 RepID=UPI001CFCE4EA|nr:hypothetical protein [Halobacillus litoralis]WLR46398.1 hypothetical protein LC065_12500 [Halobacillus litoralis]